LTNTTNLPVWLEWSRALGLPALAIAVSILTLLIARWQLIISREKLRYDLYDRRFCIYLAFHELLVAIIDKEDIETELRKALAVNAHSLFLLDSQLTTYLGILHEEAFQILQTTMLVKNETAWSTPGERAAKAALIGQDKLRLHGKINEMAKKFEPFLRLQDFRKP
jgi:hypothetical protein